MRKKIGWMALGLMFAIGVSHSAASAQEAATILQTTPELKNEKVFVKISFVGQSCSNYNLRFKLKKNSITAANYEVIKVLGVPSRSVTQGGATETSPVIGRWTATQNANGTTTTTWTTVGSTYVADLKKGDSLMIPDKSFPEYNLEFSLASLKAMGSPITADDTIEVCMESIVYAAECVGCGVGGTDMVFTRNDIASGCPYTGADVLACYKRDSKAGNWEAWIQDQRDCQSYRIVQMPGGRWWFAQNLNYWDESGSSTTKPNLRPNAVPVELPTSRLATAWCPAGLGTVAGAVSSTEDGCVNCYTDGNNVRPCATYGALYTWATVMSNDGYAATETSASLQHSMGVGEKGARRGICPDGWYVPSRSDWGKMLNIMENGCSACEGFNADGANASSKNRKSSNCFHNFADVTTNSWAASKCAFRDLLSTDVAPYRAMDGTDVNYNGGASASMTDSLVRPTAKPENPTNIHSYATDVNPRWNYYKAETAGTDKWGFSIKPTGVRKPDSSGSLFYLRGEFAGFWTSSHASAATTPTYATTPNAFIVGFRYNYRFNADFNSAVQSAAWDKNYGMAVRCIAKE